MGIDTYVDKHGYVDRYEEDIVEMTNCRALHVTMNHIPAS